MYSIKKSISVICSIFLSAVIFLNSSLFVVTKAAGINNVSYEKAANLLKELKILNDNEQNKIDFTVKCSKDQFAVLMSRMLSKKDMTFKELLNELEVEDPYEERLDKALLKEGHDLENIGGNTKSDEAILWQDAVAIIVKSLGYGIRAKISGGYPTGYTSTAKKYGITDGAVLSNDKPVTYGIAVKLLYNALYTPMMIKTGSGTDVAYIISGIYDDVPLKTLLQNKSKADIVDKTDKTDKVAPVDTVSTAQTVSNNIYTNQNKDQDQSNSNNDIKVIFDEKNINFDDVKPCIIQDRTMVPLGKIFETLGLKLSFDEATSTITAMNKDYTVILTIDQKTASVNGKSIDLDVPPTIINDRTLVPLRFLSESIGAKVEWDEKTNTASIKSK